jgi:hypothetical protein
MRNLEPLTRPIITIYEQMELDLLEAMAKRFDIYDKVGGTLEWQAAKLDEMGALNRDAVNIIAKHSKRSKKEIRQMLKEAGFANVDLPALDKAYTSGFLFVDPQKIMANPIFRSTLDDSFKELQKAFKMINTTALESVKQEYMGVLNRAYIDVSSGVYDYNTAIKRALKGMADHGISGATYRRGGKIINYSIEAAVRRDTMTAIHQAANRNSYTLAQELGADYVEVSSHAGARTHPTDHIANHAWWQGKVYKINGFDEKYGNLKANTGYPDDILGLGGVNCRHRMYPFIPGVSTPVMEQYDEKEAERVYKATQKQRAKERQIRALKRELAVAKATGQPTKEISRKLKARYEDIIAFCKKNGLERDFNRELIQGEK